MSKEISVWGWIICLTAALGIATTGCAPTTAPAPPERTIDLANPPVDVKMEAWDAPATAEGKPCRVVPDGKRLQISFPKLWPAGQFPPEAYTVRITWFDGVLAGADSLGNLFSFNDAAGDMGWHRLMTALPTGAKQWKTDTIIVDSGLLDPDTSNQITFGFAAAGGPWTVAQITIAPAKPQEIAQYRKEIFARINKTIADAASKLPEKPPAMPEVIDFGTARLRPPEAGDPAPAPFAPTPADIQRGHIPFVRDFMKGMRFIDGPDDSERKTHIHVLAARGEARAFSFGVRAIKGVTVQVSASDLDGLSGAKLPASAIELGYVQYAPEPTKPAKKGDPPVAYTLEPLYIWPLDRQPDFELGRYSVKSTEIRAAAAAGPVALALSADCAHRFWGTLRVPPGQPAGKYTGKLAMKVNGEPFDFQMSVEILPFTLPTTGLRGAGAYSPTRLTVRELRDQLDHGCNIQSIWHNGSGIIVKKEGDKFIADARAMDTYMRRMQKLGMTGPVAYYAGNSFRWFVDEEILALIKGKDQGKDHKLIEYDDREKDETPSTPGANRYYHQFDNVPEYDPAYAQWLTNLLDHADQSKWNPFLWCPMDEPAKGGNVAHQWLRDAKAAKAALGKRINIFCVIMNRGLKDPARDDAGAERFNEFADHFSVNGQIETIVNYAHPQGKQVWAYSGPNRFAHGFGMLKNGADATFFWAYNWHGQSTSRYTWATSLPLEERWNRLTPARGSHVSYPDVDGYLIPSPEWELWREGANDNRYICLLEKLLKEKAATPEAKQIAADFAKLKNSIIANETSEGGIGINEFFIDIAHASQMDQWRAQIAAWIVKLAGG